MKKTCSLLIFVCLVIFTSTAASCDSLNNGLVGEVLGTTDSPNLSFVHYQDAPFDKIQTAFGPLALINDTHTYTFPQEATQNLSSIWEYRTAHTPDGADVAYKTSSTTLMLDSAALEAAHQWLTDFYKQTGLNGATITAAYRSSEEQMHFSVPAGQSDHHSGYGITLKIVIDGVTSDLVSDPNYHWLTENAYKYGFAVRYPDAKATITGISGYENYFHYVGHAPAKYMHDNSLCLEEFVAQIKSCSVDKPLEITDASGQDWLIYYTAGQGDMATVKLPTNFTYSISGDNEGGIIVSVCLSKPVAE